MIRVAHSPDNDDFFFFWAIEKKLIDLNGIEFCFEQHHTERLNQLAIAAKYDVIAISTATYPSVAAKYYILSSGASVGRNYGPVVVAKRPFSLNELNQLTIAIPGESTTAALVLKRLAPGAITKEIPIVPHSAVFQALASGEVDAAVLIHEGQILYQDQNLYLIVDLGKWWQQRFKLPLVLGINLISRDLDPEQRRLLASTISHSIRYAQEHITEACRYLQARSDKIEIRTNKLIEYLSMYANEDSLSLKADALLGLKELIPGASIELV